MRPGRALKIGGLAVVGIALVGVYYFGLGGIHTANAASYAAACNFTAYGRTACNGYVTNTNLYTVSDGGVPEDDVLVDPSNPQQQVVPVIPASVNSASTFISFYENYLYRGSSTNYDYDSLGAAVTIEIMLGENGSDVCNWYNGSSACNWQAAIAYAQDPAHLADWEARVKYYGSNPGWISWDVGYSEKVGDPDSGHACTVSTWQCWPSSPQYPPTSGGGDAQDIAWSANDKATIETVIEFNNPDGSHFIVDTMCGNEIGYLTSGLTQPGFNMTLGASAANPSISPGSTGTINLALQNTGPNTSDSGELEVDLPSANVTAPCATTCVDPGMQPLSYGEGTYNYSQISAIPPKPAKSNWCWGTQPFPSGQPSTASLTFSVPASASLGPLTFDIYYYPSDQNGTILHTTVTFTIAGAPRYPSVVGNNADIHAGGGLCGSAQNPNGNITMNPNANSLGQYVVSASGFTSNIGSNGSNTSSALTIGNNGSYAAVCRPDLYGYATTNMPSGAGWTSVGGASFDLANPLPGQVTLPNGQVVDYISGDIGISGTLNHTLTLIASGNVSIDGDTTVTGGHGRSSLPSLGVISHQNTNIQCGCGTDRHIDAFLFSDATIDTCYTASGLPSPPHCDNVLYLNGFLMANNILFNRLGDMNGTGSQSGEVISMNPALYLNPPPFFDNSIDSLQLDGLGEEPPLF